MYNEQLNFNQEQYSNNDNNYYTFNGNQNQPITEEMYDRMQRERIQAIIENEAFKEKYLQQQSNLIQNEQLDYNIKQEDNPMLYSFGKPSYNKPPQNKTKKVAIKNKVKLTIAKKKPVLQKKNKNINRDFNVSSTALNNKGLFDPNLKVNELDRESYIDKQRQERMEKMKGYELKYGKKVKTLEKYNTFADAYSDYENKKNEYEYMKYMKNPTKGKSTVNDELIKKLNSLKKPKIPEKVNLDFNFDKYETMIKALEEQIMNEKLQREKENRAYMERLKDYHISKEDNPIMTKQIKRSKSAYRHVRSSRYGQQKKPFKINSKYHRQLSGVGSKVKQTINKAIPKQTNEEIIKEKAKRIAKSLDKIIDSDCSNDKKSTISNKTNKILPSNIDKISLQTFIDNQTNNNTQSTQPIIIQDKFTCDNYVIVSGNGIDVNTANKVITEEKIHRQFEGKNNIEMLNAINKEINNQQLPQLESKVREVIQKITKNNMITLPNNKRLQSAIKSSGKTIQLHINEIIPSIIDDLLLEQVYELQFIEDISMKNQQKNNFIQYINDFFKSYKEMELYEKDIMSQLSSQNKLAPYESCTVQNKPIPLDTKYLNQITSNNASTNNETIIARPIPSYRTVPNEILNKKCEIYKDDFLEYMKAKGSFYFENIFGIYDEVVNEIAEKELNEQLEFCTKQVNEFVSTLCKEETINKKYN